MSENEIPLRLEKDVGGAEHGHFPFDLSPRPSGEGGVRTRTPAVFSGGVMDRFACSTLCEQLFKEKMEQILVKSYGK